MSNVNYNATERYILNKLKKLSSALYFHGLNHTTEVLEAVEKLASLENMPNEEILLLKTAALYHDTGFLEQYQNNEPIGVRVAEESLPKFGYSEQQIKIISNIIMATQLPQNPKTKLEKLMCDADLNNLGREDFYIKTEQLRRELAVHGTPKTPKEWYEDLILLLEQHMYFTKAARDLGQKGKEKHLNEIKELLGI